MIKAKEGKKIVGSYKNMEEACAAMVNAKKAANLNAAKVNITAAINGSEGRTKVTSEHPILGQPRKTAYGYTWNVTKR
jgi:hypothetical protein